MVHMDSINEELSTSRSNNSFATHSSPSDSNSIILYPFAHQVGGHTQLLTLDKSTLCKPLIPRELLFYLNVPKELVEFVPSYKGVVQIRETGKGTHPPVVYQPLRSPKSPYAKYRPGLCYNDNLNEDYLSEEDSSHSVSDMCGFPFELKVQIRPCPDEKILKKNLSQDNLLRADYISRPNEKYLLLLENVASKYQLPCILDLKMGTRQHGDDATEEKRHRQIAKCQASTSASLGVRLCGMQVYQVDYGGFLWYDKYYGRKMNEDGLKRALHDYFRNGSQLNEDIIDDVIERLKLLSNAIEKSPAFRFYGTSLLIIHEGCTSKQSKSSDIGTNNNNIITTTNNNHINIEEIHDVPRSSTICTTPVSSLDSADAAPLSVDCAEMPDATSYTAIDISKQMTTSTITTESTMEPTSFATDCPILLNNKNNTSIHATTKNISKMSNRTTSSSNSRRCQVDVRLIDFAHTISSTPTTPPSLGGRKISKTSMGPDKGLLFGLENLMRLLDDLKSETLISC